MTTVEQLQARLDTSPVSCNSFVIVCRSTGKPVFETHEIQTAARINEAKYEILTALEWLQRFNKAIKN